MVPDLHSEIYDERCVLPAMCWSYTDSIGTAFENCSVDAALDFQVSRKRFGRDGDLLANVRSALASTQACC
jgi:hypothetical protein